VLATVVSLGLVLFLLLAPAGVMAQQAVRQNCGADFAKVCAGVQPGEGRIMACVREHFGQLTTPCQNALLANVTITRVCKADAEQKCGGIEPGGGRIQACMKDHFTELGDRCQHALLLAKLRKQ
jgi:Cysteine rich repeat